MQPLYVLSAVDLRRADESGSSRATTLQKLTFAAPKLITVSHSPGGGVLAVNHALPRAEAPEPKAQLVGVDVDLFRGFGQVANWTFASAYIDQDTGLDVGARGVIRAAIVQYEPDESDPESIQNCNFSFQNVTEFGFTLGKHELFYINSRTREMRFKGFDRMASVRGALGS